MLFRTLLKYSRENQKTSEVMALYMFGQFLDSVYVPAVMDRLSKQFESNILLGFALSTMLPHSVLQIVRQHLDCPKLIT